MLDITLNWKPDPTILTKLVALANQQQKPVEARLDEAIQQYFQSHNRPILEVEDDPIVGFYAGNPNLASNAENILAAEIQPQSGWTTKG